MRAHTKHSPGPWTIDRGQIRDRDGNVLASAPHAFGGAQDRANQQLMTAAPWLLKAVDGFLWLGNNLDNITHDPEQFRRYYEAALKDARLAYTQATGGEP